MKLTAHVLCLDIPLVVVTYESNWLSRLVYAATGGLFGRRSCTRTCEPLHRNASVWVFVDDLRVVDDETYAAIVDAVTDARLSRSLERVRVAAQKAADEWRRLTAVADDQLN